MNKEFLKIIFSNSVGGITFFPINFFLKNSRASNKYGTSYNGLFFLSAFAVKFGKSPCLNN